MPDIVIMDIKMPVMNGIEATQIAIKKYPAPTRDIITIGTAMTSGLIFIFTSSLVLD